ncbi:hypothetical protein ACSQ67_001184 [Phaseolus vulgaris]
MQGSDKIIDATLYERTVGSLRFLCSSKSDIAYGVGWISRMYGSCKISSLLAPKRILRYAKGTLGYGLLFSTHDRNISDEVFGYCDSDWSGASSRAEMLFVFYWVRLGPATLSLPALASSQLFHPELLTQDFALTGIIQSPVGQSFLLATQHLQAPESR